MPDPTERGVAQRETVRRGDAAETSAVPGGPRDSLHEMPTVQCPQCSAIFGIEDADQQDGTCPGCGTWLQVDPDKVGYRVRVAP